MRFLVHTAQQLADLIGASVVGDPDRSISGLNEIHVIEPGDLAFVDHPKYYDKVLGSAASAVLIDKEVACPADKTLLVTSSPFQAFIDLIAHFRPFKPSDGLVDSSAIIDPTAVIQPGARVGRGAIIGANAIIHANAAIGDWVEIGARSIIHANAVIGGDAFYYQKREGKFQKFLSGGTVVVGQDVEIGAGTTIDRGATGDTTVGDGTKIDNLVHIGHDTRIGKNCLFAAQVGIAGATIIEDDVTLWGQVGVISGITIGKGAVVMAQSGIGKSVPGGTTYFGSPASEGREKMREMAALRQLPELIKRLGNK